MIIFCALLGLLQAWTTRLQMSPDGISYIDIAYAYLRGDWKNALNAYWSPLYSWFLGIVFALLNSSPKMEFAAMHLLNWIIYLFCIGSFELLLREIHLAQRHDLSVTHRSSLSDVSHFLWRGIVYALFLWGTLKMIGLNGPCPDLLAACFVFIASALLIRMYRAGISLNRAILLGVVLGIGYLAKLHLLILSAVYFACGWIFIRASGKSRAIWIGAYVSFLIVVLPFGIALSKNQGHLTFGEAGKLNYAWWVNCVPPYKHWHPENQDHGTPIHTTRIILQDPVVYEFSRPILGTYPVWYDPVYWMEGIRPRLDVRQQLFKWRESAVLYVKILTRGFPGSLIIGLLLCCLMGWLPATSLTRLQALLIVPSLAAMMMFGSVHIETRFIAPFVTLIFLAFLSMVSIPDTAGTSIRFRWAVGCFLVVLTGTLAANLYPRLLPPSQQGKESSDDYLGGENDWRIADALHKAGIVHGDSVAILGNGFYAFWARMARVRIVAEVPSRFTNTPGHWRDVMEALRKTGAAAVVADQSKVPGSPPGWQELGTTGFCVFKFPSGTANRD